MIRPRQIYKHYKGKLYIIEMIAENWDSGSKLVILSRLNPEDSLNNNLLAMPIDEFLSTVTHYYSNAEDPRLNGGKSGTEEVLPMFVLVEDK